MINIRKILAANLKEKRRKLGLTQENLAKRAGLSLQYLAMLELARKFPSGEMLERLAAALNVEPHQLFGVPAPPDEALERLHRTIAADIQRAAADMKQIVRETIQETLSGEGRNGQR